VNIRGRGFLPFPIRALFARIEPTAGLDPTNRATVLALICRGKARGAAISGIFHDGGSTPPAIEICDRQTVSDL